MMKRIYVNGRFLTRPMTGVERYAYMVCKTMRQQGMEFTVVCPKAPVQSCYDVSDLTIVFYGHGNSHLWEQFVLPFFFLNKRKYVFFSFTGLGSILVRHQVMTIHDLSFLENPRWFSRGYYWWYKVMTPLAARTSEHILTVSEFSKHEILRFYPFLRSQGITVAYGAPDKIFRRQESDGDSASEPFALVVSSLDPRKNFSRLIEAFNEIRGCKLYIVGAHNRVFTQAGDTERQGSNLCFLGRVSDDELVRLYNQTVCFVFPSLYEGFGLPPIEAMNCGCPVLVSDIPVLREVCADAALYFDPHDSKKICHSIQYFLDNRKSLGPTLQARGYENVKRFSWEQTAGVIVRLAR